MLNRIVVLGAMALTLFLLVWGLAGDTPYSLEGDEMYCVGRATEMARRNDLNPHWFAHPASTTIYPLVLYYHLLDATYFHGAFSEGSAENVICDNIVLTAYLPRFVNVFLVLACIPLIFSIGRRVFGKVAAYFAVFFFGVSPLLLSYAQVVRSEAPALFFSVLAIYFSLKLLEAPSLKLHILVGLAIGLGISSRYPMLALAPLFCSLMHGGCGGKTIGRLDLSTSVMDWRGVPPCL